MAIELGIIAHVDHGKSTLCDRLLQHCGVLPQGAPEQFLDGLEVERKRGITVKAHIEVKRDYIG